MCEALHLCALKNSWWKLYSQRTSARPKLRMEPVPCGPILTLNSLVCVKLSSWWPASVFVSPDSSPSCRTKALLRSVLRSFILWMEGPLWRKWREKIRNVREKGGNRKDLEKTDIKLLKVYKKRRIQSKSVLYLCSEKPHICGMVFNIIPWEVGSIVFG